MVLVGTAAHPKMPLAVPATGGIGAFAYRARGGLPGGGGRITDAMADAVIAAREHRDRSVGELAKQTAPAHRRAARRLAADAWSTGH